MSAQFQLKQAKNGKHYFNLLAANGEVVLTSQMYATKAGARKGIASVQSHCGDTTRYDRCEQKSGKVHFVLKSANHRVIGTSQGYRSPASMEKGIKSVIKSGQTKRTVPA